MLCIQSITNEIKRREKTHKLIYTNSQHFCKAQKNLCSSKNCEFL